MRIDGAPSVDRKTSSDVLEKMPEIRTKLSLEMADSHPDRAHRIGKPYLGKIKKVKCKSIIVRFKGYQTEETTQNQIRFNQKQISWHLIIKILTSATQM